MKDLKHLIYFEDLLQEANNELVKQAAADGKKALGYTCYFVPEVLLNLAAASRCACVPPARATPTSVHTT